MKQPCVYILAGGCNRTLCVGVTCSKFCCEFLDSGLRRNDGRRQLTDAVTLTGAGMTDAVTLTGAGMTDAVS